MIGHHGPKARSHSDQSERGSVMLLAALTMFVLLIMTTIVVDLGSARVTKRSLQNTSDVAALAAGYHLSGRGNALVTADPRAACAAALRSLKTNFKEISAGASIPCSALAATAEAPDCTTSTAMKTVTATGADPYTVTISYPVPDSAISDSRYVGGSGPSDGAACMRMRVEINRTRAGAFSGIVGRDNIALSARSVVRGAPNTTSGSVPALLLLDRTGCQVVTNSSGGNGNLGIVVRRVSATEGGRMHSDSDGTDCGSTSTAYVTYGSPLSGGGSSITVENAASGGELGTITTYATTTGSLRGGATYPGGLSHPVTAGPVVSRVPFDRQFNPSNRDAIGQLHSAAYGAVTMTPGAAAAAGYTVVNCAADGTIAGARIFVNCSTYQPNAAVFSTATDVIFSGQVNVRNGKTLSLPFVNRMYVRGCSTCTGGSYYSLSVVGGLYVNIGSAALGSATCDTRNGPGAGGVTTNTTTLVTFGSPIAISGQARLCQTTGYMAEDASTYVRRATVTGGPNCSSALPCPISSGAAPGGSYAVTGDNTQWSAPNQTSSAASTLQPFEDLALWSESSDLSTVKSGGVMYTAGIFFTPNAPIQFSSPASGVPRNAQMVARTLILNQGTLDMAPVGRDAVRVPLPGGYGLIR